MWADSSLRSSIEKMAAVLSTRIMISRSIIHANNDRHFVLNSHAFQNLNKGEVVVFMQIEGDFVKVRLNNGTQGWVVWNQIKPCTISSNN